MFESRRRALIRTTLIGYGVLAFAWLLSRSGLEPQALGGFASAQSLFVMGLVVQIVLTIARWIIKYRVSDADAAAQTLSIIDLLGDGATVFLFALGTLGAVLHFPAAV